MKQNIKQEKKRISPAKFIREVKSEALRVVWPTKKEMIASTITVIVLIFISAIFFLLVDNIAEWLIGKILGLS